MLVRFGPALILVALACRSVVEPQPDSPSQRHRSSAIGIGSLAPGDVAVVDLHLEGCFIYYDAQFRIDARETGVFLAGTVDLPLVVHRPSRATVPVRQLSPKEIHQIDNLLDIYRREARAGGCTTRINLNVKVTGHDGAVQEEHYFDGSCANFGLDQGQRTSQALQREDAFFFTRLASQAIGELIASWR